MEMNETIIAIIPLLMKLVFGVIGLIATAYVFPWAKRYIQYSVIRMLVQAAEKKAEAGSLPKYKKPEYVKNLMMLMHIPVNDFTMALMESAVMELDILKDQFVEYFSEDEPPDEIDYSKDAFDVEDIVNEFHDGKANPEKAPEESGEVQ